MVLDFHMKATCTLPAMRILKLVHLLALSRETLMAAKVTALQIIRAWYLHETALEIGMLERQSAKNG